MYVRVVRFTGVTVERMEAIEAQVREAGGPPPGVSSTGISFLYDAGQQSVVVLQHYASESDMQESAKVLDAMDTGETPGTRASVDSCEVRLELKG